MTDACQRVAMWSGPRNLSTAMMYSFAQRSDTQVLDEPFYAAYLSATGIRHGMYRQVIAAGETEPAEVVRQCCDGNEDGAPVFYQKHMTKHMVAGFDRSWLRRVRNVFLIRDPARVMVSYQAREGDPGLADIGIKEQLELFDQVCQDTGSAPLVVNSADILADPEAMLRALCAALDLPFQTQMLHWPAGPKPYDGVWAPHWYAGVWRSTGFAAAESAEVVVPERLRAVLEQADGYYRRIRDYALVPAPPQPQPQPQPQP